VSELIVLFDKTMFELTGKFTFTVTLKNNLISLLINLQRGGKWVGAVIKVSTPIFCV